MFFSGTAAKLIGKVLIIVLAIFGIYLGYLYFTSERPPEEFDYFREHVLDIAAKQLAGNVAGTEEKPSRLLLAGDPKSRVMFVIRKALLESGRVELLDPEFAGDAEQSVKDWFFSAVRGVIKPEEAKVAQALAEQSKAEAILFTDFITIR